MNNDILNKLDIIIKDINNSYECKEITKVKSVLLNNKDLLKEIEFVKNSSYSKEYIDNKKDILENKDFKKYKELEFEIMKFSNSVSKKLSSLTKEGGKCENHKW